MEGKLLIILFSLFLGMLAIPTNTTQQKQKKGIELVEDVRRLNDTLLFENKILEEKVKQKVKKGQLAIDKLGKIKPDTVIVERLTVVHDTIYSFRRLQNNEINF